MSREGFCEYDEGDEVGIGKSDNLLLFFRKTFNIKRVIF